MIYDISRPIHGDMAVFKNFEFKRPESEMNSTFAKNAVNESTWTINLHTGSHVDAPCHMIEDGISIDQVDPALYVGRCKVFDLTHVEDAIHAADVQDLDIQGGDIVLFKTRNSFDEGFNPDFVYLAEDAAARLVKAGVRTIGIDAMSIERDQPNHRTHVIVLGAGVGILEDIRLAEVPAGEYFLHAPPLHLVGGDGSPVRALLSTL